MASSCQPAPLVIEWTCTKRIVRKRELLGFGNLIALAPCKDALKDDLNTYRKEGCRNIERQSRGGYCFWFVLVVASR